jgi:hypothetical protein
MVISYASRAFFKRKAAIFQIIIYIYNHRNESAPAIAKGNKSVCESVSSALVKAFQVFHPTKFELLYRRRARWLQKGGGSALFQHEIADE